MIRPYLIRLDEYVTIKDLPVLPHLKADNYFGISARADLMNVLVPGRAYFVKMFKTDGRVVIGEVLK